MKALRARKVWNGLVELAGDAEAAAMAHRRQPVAGIVGCICAIAAAFCAWQKKRRHFQGLRLKAKRVPAMQADGAAEIDALAAIRAVEVFHGSVRNGGWLLYIGMRNAV